MPTLWRRLDRETPEELALQELTQIAENATHDSECSMRHRRIRRGRAPPSCGRRRRRACDGRQSKVPASLPGDRQSPVVVGSGSDVAFDRVVLLSSVDGVMTSSSSNCSETVNSINVCAESDCMAADTIVSLSNNSNNTMLLQACTSSNGVSKAVVNNNINSMSSVCTPNCIVTNVESAKLNNTLPVTSHHAAVQLQQPLNIRYHESLVGVSTSSLVVMPSAMTSSALSSSSSSWLASMSASDTCVSSIPATALMTTSGQSDIARLRVGNDVDFIGPCPAAGARCDDTWLHHAYGDIFTFPVVSPTPMEMAEHVRDDSNFN